jgi:hypothetical protein
MFDKLKKAFSRAAKGIAQKELTEKVLDDILLDLRPVKIANCIS